jgi:membrane associated rhomboid family serine protease
MQTNPFSRFTRSSSFRFGPGASIPPMVRLLLGVNIGVFILQKLAGWDPIANFALIPAEMWPLKLYTLVSYMFLHGGFLHIGFNMFMLWMFGTAIEYAWGAKLFLRYYFVCGIGGGITQALVGLGFGGGYIPIIGASAAIMGLLLAYGMMYPNQLVYLYGLIGIRMKYLVVGLVLIDLVGALGRGGTTVAHFAHLGGMLFGWLYLSFDSQLNGVVRRMRATFARRKMEQNRENVFRQSGRTSGDRPGDASVDEILEKISEHGIESLTPREREILRNASRH